MTVNYFNGVDPRDLLEVTKALINTESVSGQEDELCNLLIEYVKSFRPDAEIVRIANSFVVKVNAKNGEVPVIFAGHLDTVPVAEHNGQKNNVATISDGNLFGLGASDMKSGLAVMVALLADIEISSHFVFYEAEEVEAQHSGLLKIRESDPTLLDGKCAILLEPTDGKIELGCQGTISAKAVFNGKRAHSARPWMGENAIHKSVKVLEKLVQESKSQPQLEIEGLTYTSALSVTTIAGGVARNVIPDYCELVLNHRYSPNISAQDAENYVRSLCSEADEIEIVDNTPGAMPSIDHPIVPFAKETNVELVPKVAWTDVARFSEWGVAAVNCGPGDPAFAHRSDEHIQIKKLEETYNLLSKFINTL